MCNAHISKVLGCRTQVRISVIIAMLLAMILSIHAAEAAPVAWQQNVHNATRAAVEQNKPLLIMVGARWCGYCQKMEQQTFRDPKIQRTIADHFIPVLIDADEQPEIAQQLKATALPTLLVISPDLHVLQRTAGFQSAEELGGRLAGFYATSPVRKFHPAPNHWRDRPSDATLSAAVR